MTVRKGLQGCFSILEQPRIFFSIWIEERSYSDLLDSPEDRTSAWLRVYHHVELSQDGGRKVDVMPLPGLLF